MVRNCYVVEAALGELALSLPRSKELGGVGHAKAVNKGLQKEKDNMRSPSSKKWISVWGYGRCRYPAST